MAVRQKDRQEVQEFLSKAKYLISEGTNVQLNCMPWAGGRVNKTQQYMAETGIGKKDIENVVSELQVSNYSFTTDDQNSNFVNEQFWIFGITKNLVDKEEDLYIKLKIRMIGEEMLLIMSFHPEEPENDNKKLRFPYTV